jgi:hypothetical protein
MSARQSRAFVAYSSEPHRQRGSAALPLTRTKANLSIARRHAREARMRSTRAKCAAFRAEAVRRLAPAAEDEAAERDAESERAEGERADRDCFPPRRQPLLTPERFLFLGRERLTAALLAHRAACT